MRQSPDGVPLLLCRRISSNAHHRIIEVSDAEYPADRTELRFITPLKTWPKKRITRPGGPMSTDATTSDQTYLCQAIDLSRHALEDEGKTPFGAILVVHGQVVGEGTSSVVELHDPSAHAEIMALRHAGQRLQHHLMPDSIMYASSQPCPMCLIACYWARIARIVYAATIHDTANNGFEDLQLYRLLRHDPQDRPLAEHAHQDLRSQAADILTAWTKTLPEPVIPKL
jgi:guanine deaminase